MTGADVVLVLLLGWVGLLLTGLGVLAWRWYLDRKATREWDRAALDQGYDRERRWDQSL